MSHTNHDMLKQMHGALRQLSEEMGRPIGILCDLQGPKIRLGTIPGGSRMLVQDEKVRLVLGETAKHDYEIPIPHPEIFDAIKQKHALLIDGGKVHVCAYCAEVTISQKPWLKCRARSRTARALTCPTRCCPCRR